MDYSTYITYGVCALLVLIFILLIVVIAKVGGIKKRVDTQTPVDGGLTPEDAQALSNNMTGLKTDIDKIRNGLGAFEGKVNNNFQVINDNITGIPEKVTPAETVTAEEVEGAVKTNTEPVLNAVTEGNESTKEQMDALTQQMEDLKATVTTLDEKTTKIDGDIDKLCDGLEDFSKYVIKGQNKTRKDIIADVEKALGETEARIVGNR